MNRACIQWNFPHQIGISRHYVEGLKITADNRKFWITGKLFKQ